MNDRATILAVDDTPESLALLVKILSPAGYQVRPADSGELALAAAAASAPDLILLDVRMPGMDGLEVCRRLKASEQTRHIPIILISSFADVKDWVAGLHQGAADFITKPFRPEELLKRVETHLSLSRASVSLELQAAALRQVNERLGSEIFERQRVEDELRQNLDRAERSRRAMLSTLEDQKRAELKSSGALAEAQRFRKTLDHVSSFIYMKDRQSRYVYANRPTLELFGCSAEELVGRDDSHFFPPDTVQRLREVDRRVFGGEETAVEIDVAEAGGGRHVYWEVKTPIYAEADSKAVWGLLGISTDITERKKLEEQLRQSQKMEAVGQLAGGVAHDFNNLLQAMLGLSQTLVAHFPDPERLKADAAEMEQLAKRGAALTRQLLLFARRDTARPLRLDLNEVVRDGISLLRRLLKANVAIEAPLAEGQLPVKADRGQLGQVLLNLSVNAADAMPDGGRLAIRTGSEGATVWLKVTDTGGGIPAAIREHIFEPFFTTKGQGKGTGLGLSVVHGIVTQLGGTVAVESREGQGTTFTVTLPRAGSEEIPAVEIAERGAAPPRGHGERVLVVEDEDSARLSLAEILSVLGYAVTAVGSGEEAGRLAPETPFDVLLTDLMLPGISGGDLAIGLQERWPDLRVVLMSGYTEDEAVRLALWAGTVRFLQKPFDMDVLANELRAALETR